jgi:hypothetical protein
MLDKPTGCSTRTITSGGLATYSVAAVLIVLTRPYPPPSQAPQVLYDSHGLNLPPGWLPALIGGLFAVFTVAVATGIAIRNIGTSLQGHQWPWALLFLVLGLAGLLAPVLLFFQASFSHEQWNGVALISGIGVLLTFIAALLYTHPSHHLGQL